MDTVLEPLRGHRRYNAIMALRSLFRFAKRHGLTFAGPTGHQTGSTDYLDQHQPRGISLEHIRRDRIGCTTGRELLVSSQAERRGTVLAVPQVGVAAQWMSCSRVASIEMQVTGVAGHRKSQEASRCMHQQATSFRGNLRS